ncbi:hypothetical protein POPTR_003G080800v4 [Populus trichocarpa]|uniref:Uncharacterized protein n=2 Tax=Populus trichocarpa TaxID=3694 RepID=A0ACC0T8W5_POPTR|nr:hypothetical protein POPTR_003G080800v4 [Populus trichocarpa]KAI9397799.1 hypothetical protein POPTR_003G080800v4 [Populus trichocarpa]
MIDNSLPRPSPAKIKERNPNLSLCSRLNSHRNLSKSLKNQRNRQMGTFTALTRSLGHRCVKKSKSNNLPNLYIYSNGHQYQTHRTLILESLSYESVRLRRLSDSDSGIVEVNLDRPAAKNSIGKEMLRGLRNAFETIESDESAQVVLICSSVPKVFCAGADLKALRVPTIAVIEGVALGGGLEMALSCDLRICGEDAVLGLPETGLAIIPGAGGTQRLPRLVGKSLAKELIFTGRKIGGREYANGACQLLCPCQ